MRRIEIFVPLRGQYDNVGDVILRRQLLRWLQGAGHVQAYIGHAPAGFAEALGLSAGDVVHRELGPWVRAMVTGRVGRAYVFKPGEIQVTLGGMKEHLGMLPAIAAVRARGGVVVRVAQGARLGTGRAAVLLRPSVALSNETWWRDDYTRDLMGRGEVMPDLAYGEGATGAVLAERSPGERLVVSLRVDRPYPDVAWLRGVTDAAALLGLHPTVVTQVARDVERSERLARDLGVVPEPWVDDLRAQEAALREVFASSGLVISDRLHVLIAGLTEGAIPVGISDRSGKIASHFDSAGFGGVAADTTGWASETVTAHLARQAGRRDEHLAVLRDVRDRLEQRRSALGMVLRRGVSDQRP